MVVGKMAKVMARKIVECMVGYSVTRCVLGFSSHELY